MHAKLQPSLTYFSENDHDDCGRARGGHGHGHGHGDRDHDHGDYVGGYDHGHENNYVNELSYYFFIICWDSNLNTHFHYVDVFSLHRHNFDGNAQHISFELSTDYLGKEPHGMVNYPIGFNPKMVINYIINPLIHENGSQTHAKQNTLLC